MSQLGQPGFLRSVALVPERAAEGYPFDIPAISNLGTLELDPRVTFLVGENGSGKSTLVEAIAVASGFNAEGGTRNMQFATRASHSQLHEALRLGWAKRPRDGFFLRAESFYNVATHVDGYGDLSGVYGGSLHERSHGESFVALVTNRFGDGGFFILDEPEAALSVRGQLALMRRMHDLVAEQAQFLVATHSPILLAFPGAAIYELTSDGPVRTAYEETEQVQLTRSFLDDPERFFHHLLAD